MKCDIRHISSKKFKRAASPSVSICGHSKSGRRRASRPARFLHSVRSAASLERVRAPIVFSICISTFLNYFHCWRDTGRCDLQRTRRAHFGGERRRDKQKCRARCTAAAAHCFMPTYVCEDLDCARPGSGAFIYPKHASDNGALLFVKCIECVAAISASLCSLLWKLSSARCEMRFALQWTRLVFAKTRSVA